MDEAQQIDTTITQTEPQTIPQTETTLVSSPTCSPTHEFSFTISLHSSSAATTTPSSPKHHKSPSAIDLTPADDIFFHGHLLPLHFLSHLHASLPRSSTNSRDSFTLPKPDPKPKPVIHSFPQDRPTTRPKPLKSAFSLSALSKWIKGSDPKDKSEKRKVKFDVTQFLKRYVKMVKPLLSSPKSGDKFNGRGHYNHTISAPASMRTSPTNSGRLVPSSGVPSPVSESTMEELQAAIQAAIAHCKKSTTSEPETSHGLSTSPVSVN
ncbi:hypothetical protein RND81_03G048900 [Saponaria officinalis]|uniref:BRI1 kinase inhibitor 1 n=1 Tax=Saponaria officinalis TaxID=3572 RepID=A0AAW1M5J6_SAPOF